MNLKVPMGNNNSISVILAGAGKSSRMGEKTSKQFSLLQDKPLLLYSLDKFNKISDIKEVIIVTNDLNLTKELVSKENYNFKVKLIEGKELRQDSVKNGFSKVDPLSELVIIHDVARPLFTIEDLLKCIDSAQKIGGAILGIPLVDTIKKAELDNDELFVEKTLSRENLYLIQTPQVFSYKLMAESYNMYKGLVVTDEAAILESLDKRVALIIGSRRNIKITYPEDLEIATAILKSKELVNN